MSLVTLRAEAAMRAEDLRIARKHRAEAGARLMTRANHVAWLRAVSWEGRCAERARLARVAVIEAIRSANPTEPVSFDEALQVPA